MMRRTGDGGGGPVERGDAWAALDVEAREGRSRGRDVARLAVRRRQARLPVAVAAALVVAVLVGLSGAVVSGVEAAVTFVGLVVVVVWWPLIEPGGGGIEKRWRAWRTLAGGMVQALRRSLSAEWTVLWHRRLPGVSEPVTVVVGPAGVWGFVTLWPAGPEDGTGEATSQAKLEATKALGELLPAGLMVEVCVARIPDNDVGSWRVTVDDVAGRVVVLDARDVNRLAGRVEQQTLAAPLNVDAA